MNIIKKHQTKLMLKKLNCFWRRHPDSNRGSKFCRLMPYRLAMSPGARDGAQTRDLCLGKASLYQLSYSRITLIV